MKAPLLLGNNIPKMDEVALGVVKNVDAINISQDALGVQAQRVWTAPGPGAGRLDGVNSASAVAAHCSESRQTQVWKHVNGNLVTTDASGRQWCLHDVEGTEEVGSWRARVCSEASSTRFEQVKLSNGGTAVVTPGGGHLTVNNAFGGSGPVQHTRYLSTDHTRSESAAWVRKPVGTESAFRLMAADRTRIRDDDKMGGVKLGGDFCLDLANDGDLEVWAGPLANKRWAVALLNRDATSAAPITVNYTMFNATATSTFDIRDVWSGQDIGSHQGSYTSTVAPQAVTYLILTPP